MLTADEVGSIEDGNKSIKKCKNLSKTGKLSKFKNPHPTSAMEECNFFTSNAKTDFKF